MSKLAPARKRACEALISAERQGAYVREVLEAADAFRALDERDAGLALRLALGTTATVGCLDELIDRFVTRPGRLDARVRMALRLAAFELVYLNRAPAVAVSQGVELVRSSARSAAGLANAVLRKMAEAREGYLAACDVPPNQREQVAQARAAGLPVWLDAALERSLGTEAARALEAGELEPAPLAFHGNPRAAARESTSLPLAAPDTLLPGLMQGPDARHLISSGALTRAGAVASDLNAQLVATAATAPGALLEVGAGRGTKTFVIAAQEERLGWHGEHVAVDLSPRKGELNRARLHAAGLDAGIIIATGDGTQLGRALQTLDQQAGLPVLFDTVLVDAPCSGTGTMRRHPEIPWRLDKEDVERALPALQLAMLEEAARQVKPAGQLLYATCSVLRSENHDVVDAFLSSEAGREFTCVPVSSAPVFDHEGYRAAAAYLREHENAQGCFQTVPTLGTFDGHFCARFVRRA